MAVQSYTLSNGGHDAAATSNKKKQNNNNCSAGPKNEWSHAGALILPKVNCKCCIQAPTSKRDQIPVGGREHCWDLLIAYLLSSPGGSISSVARAMAMATSFCPVNRACADVSTPGENGQSLSRRPAGRKSILY